MDIKVNILGSAPSSTNVDCNSAESQVAIRNRSRRMNNLIADVLKSVPPGEVIYSIGNRVFDP